MHSWAPSLCSWTKQKRFTNIRCSFEPGSQFKAATKDEISDLNRCRNDGKVPSCHSGQRHSFETSPVKLRAEIPDKEVGDAVHADIAGFILPVVAADIIKDLRWVLVRTQLWQYFIVFYEISPGTIDIAIQSPESFYNFNL
jgi:hypothetical protein